MAKLEFLSDEYLEEIYQASKSFHNGIYVNYEKVKEIKKDLIHPCGWDFISFICVDEDDPNDCIYNYLFRIEDISEGIYSSHPLEDLTLKEILEIVGENGWSFESI